MPLNPGTKLGHFQIVAAIGEGGMGEVYRAHDAKLDRDVAIKVIRADALESTDRRDRFVREAKAAAVLNHPNIATVYEIDEAAGLTFIAMELIEGEKLSDLIATGELSAERAVEIAIDVAEGLSAAHAKNIVHRDLKPANIMVLADGRPKIIDFGLAKLLETGSEGETATKAQTMVGTVAYMSPEQARSVEIDHRSDIFSFGVVLHEMLSGEKPFEGPSVPETLNAIIWDLDCSPDGKEIAFYAYRSGNRDLWVVPAEGGAARQLTFDEARDSYPTWSPDGTRIAFDSRRSRSSDIWLLTLASGEIKRLTSDPGNERTPTWAPDGKWIVFNTGRRLARIPADGGEPESLGEGDFPSFSPDGSFLFVTNIADGAGNIWAIDPETKTTHAATDLTGRPGGLGTTALAADGHYIYFTWMEDTGDIWVADVVDES